MHYLTNYIICHIKCIDTDADDGYSVRSFILLFGPYCYFVVAWTYVCVKFVSMFGLVFVYFLCYSGILTHCVCILMQYVFLKILWKMFIFVTLLFCTQFSILCWKLYLMCRLQWWSCDIDDEKTITKYLVMNEWNFHNFNVATVSCNFSLKFV